MKPKSAANIFLGIGLAVLALPVLSLSTARAGDSDNDMASDPTLAGNPYLSIVARNVFNLVPIPTNNPADDAKEPDPPSKITPNGIMSLFGTPQVLFKVAFPPKPGQPPQDKSYVMSEGDREDGISVIRIDQAAGIITFDNNGIVQKIPLVASTDGGGGPGAGPGGSRGPDDRIRGRFPGRGMIRGGGSGYGYQPNGGFTPSPASAPESALANNNNGSTPATASPGYGQGSALSVEGAQAKLQSMVNDPNYLTPEAQALMIEHNRLEAQQAGDPTAALIPPTEITSEVQGGGGDTGN